MEGPVKGNYSVSDVASATL